MPTRNGTERARQEASEGLRLDLAALQLRARRGHDLRRTFISMALVDGARRDLLETVTHGPRGDIISVYSTFPWPALCAEVAKLKIKWEATSRCNECNEALDIARDVLANARRLALVAQNALLNADLRRASSVLRDLQIATSIDFRGHGSSTLRDCTTSRA